MKQSSFLSDSKESCWRRNWSKGWGVIYRKVGRMKRASRPVVVFFLVVALVVPQIYLPSQSVGAAETAVEPMVSAGGRHSLAVKSDGTGSGPGAGIVMASWATGQLQISRSRCRYRACLM